MEQRESFISGKSFAETCYYLDKAFFPELKVRGVGGGILLPSPKVAVNEPGRFAMRRTLEPALMFLRVEVRQMPDGQVVVEAISTFAISRHIIRIGIPSLLSCGLLTIIFGPLLYLKYQRWCAYLQKAMRLLKEDLSPHLLAAPY